MLSQATQLGCNSAANTTCLCSTPNFQYGVRDCIAQTCPPTDAATVAAFGKQFCAGELEKYPSEN